MDKVIVVKLGGSTFGNEDTTIADIVELQKQGKSLVVVHGGRLITEWLSKQGISTRFVQGERVTDKTALEVSELNQALLKWEEVYNTIRPHQALGYLTPLEFLEQYQQKRREVMCH